MGSRNGVVAYFKILSQHSPGGKRPRNISMNNVRCACLVTFSLTHIDRRYEYQDVKDDGLNDVSKL
jgi:hypothetical protein